MAAKGALRNLVNVIGEFQKLERTILLDTLNIFLLVASKPGITSKEIQIKTGIPQSTVSRHLIMLTDAMYKDKEGPGLIELVVDPNDNRYKNPFLTHKGRAFALKIAMTINPDINAGLADFPMRRDLQGAGAR